MTAPDLPADIQQYFIEVMNERRTEIELTPALLARLRALGGHGEPPDADPPSSAQWFKPEATRRAVKVEVAFELGDPPDRLLGAMVELFEVLDPGLERAGYFRRWLCALLDSATRPEEYDRLRELARHVFKVTAETYRRTLTAVRCERHHPEVFDPIWALLGENARRKRERRPLTPDEVKAALGPAAAVLRDAYRKKDRDLAAALEAELLWVCKQCLRPSEVTEDLLIEAAGAAPAADLTLVDPDPEPWPEPVEGAALLDALAALYARFVKLPNGSADALALWTVNTYTFEAFDIAPILCVSSPEAECGKTTTMTLVKYLASRALMCSNITPPAIFRMIGLCQPTLITDEFDSFAHLHEELRNIYNAGHDRAGATVIRCVGDNSDPKKFSVWCCKAIALIGMPPRTIKLRSIIVALKKMKPTDQVEKLTRPHRQLPPLTEPLRQQVIRWAADHRAALEEADPTLPEELVNRLGDNWRPLLAIADLAGGTWPKRARSAARSLVGFAKPDEDSPGLLLLADVRALYHQRGNPGHLLTDELLRHLHVLDDRPWKEYGRDRRPLSDRGLAKLLERYEIRPTNVWPANRRGYALADFEDAWARYLPPYPHGAHEAHGGAGLGAVSDPHAAPTHADGDPSVTNGIPTPHAVHADTEAENGAVREDAPRRTPVR